MHDLRYAARTLRRSPGFTLVAALSLALGIGANTAILTVLDAVVWRELPVRQPERLVLVNRAGAFNAFSYPLLRALQQRQQVFEGMLGSSELRIARVSLAGGRPLDPVLGELVTRNYFAVLGAGAWRGRVFAEADRDPVVVISHRFWERALQRRPDALGLTLSLNGAAAAIAGVMPPGFFGEATGRMPDLFIPADLQPQLMPGTRWLTAPNSNWLAVMGRLKPGMSERAAEASLNAIYPGMPGAAGRIALEAGGRGLRALRDRFGQPLAVLMAVAALLLLIACSNVANLLLARGAARSREIGIRLAVGAGRFRLVRQLLAESLLLAVGGGLAAFWIALYGGRALVALASDPSNPIHLAGGLDWRIFGFTAAVSVVTAFLFGLVPALRAARAGVTSALQTASKGFGGGSRQGMSKALVVAQVALSLVLLAAAGLLVRSLQNLRHADPGFDRRNVLLGKLDFPPSRAAMTRMAALAGPLAERLGALPGVRSCALSTYGGLNRGNETESISLPSRPAEPGEVVRLNHVSAGYFETYGIALRRGRRIGAADTGASPRVAVVNESMARQYFGNDDPLGKVISFGKSYDARKAVEIVGLVRDTRYASLRERMYPQVFIPLSQGWDPPGYVALRTFGSAPGLAAQARQAISQVDPGLAFDRITTLEENLEATLIQERLLARLCGFFGLSALLLAAIGIYGALSYAVARRTREIGVRMALGATPSRVSGMVLRDVLALAGLGCAMGLAAALAGVRLMRNLLFGLTPHDPATMAGTVMLLLAVALAAAFLPAHRASRMDPLAALRCE